MEVNSKENFVGLTSNRSTLKAASIQVTKKPKALADVGNILHSAKKKTQDFSKPSNSSQKLESTKNFKIFVEEKDVIFSPAPKKDNAQRIPLSPISGTKIAANLNPCYAYDDDTDDDGNDLPDGHDKCTDKIMNDDFDNFLSLKIRLNSDDFDSLAMLKPPEESWRSQWKSNISVLSDESDLNDFNVPFPSPPKFTDFDLPFDEFVVPEIDFDASF